MKICQMLNILREIGKSENICNLPWTETITELMKLAIVSIIVETNFIVSKSFTKRLKSREKTESNQFTVLIKSAKALHLGLLWILAVT